MSIPTFTPPTAPTFTPPKQTGPCCAHHPNEAAVGKCSRCGKNICQDCSDVYGVTKGKYAGKCLCYDCCQSIVNENIETLKKQKGKYAFNLILTAIGMIIGYSLFAGEDSGVAIFGMLWIGSFWYWLTTAFGAYRDMCKGGKLEGFVGHFFGIFWSALFSAIVAPINTIIKIIKFTKYIVKANKAIKLDLESLVQMKEYMEYTLVRSQNKGVDLEDLMAEGSKLYSNSYARNVHENGETYAEQQLSQRTTRIAENGEIIRNFAA